MPGLSYSDQLPVPQHALLIDTRATDVCHKNTLAHALCLSAESLMTPAQRIPSLRAIAWLLGTYGLQGDEAVIVIGTEASQRDFVAGLLYLSGQENVLILSVPVGQLLARASTVKSAGKVRGQSRSAIYSAAPRDQQILLRDELWGLIQNPQQPLLLLDARTDAEYWGHHIRAARGGHIPGASLWGQSSDLDMALIERAVTVIYAHDPVDTIAAFTRLQAGRQDAVRVYIEGWRSWAAQGVLPADAESFKQEG